MWNSARSVAVDRRGERLHPRVLRSRDNVLVMVTTETRSRVTVGFVASKVDWEVAWKTSQTPVGSEAGWGSRNVSDSLLLGRQLSCGASTLDSSARICVRTSAAVPERNVVGIDETVDEDIWVGRVGESTHISSDSH